MSKDATPGAAPVAAAEDDFDAAFAEFSAAADKANPPNPGVQQPAEDDDADGEPTEPVAADPAPAVAAPSAPAAPAAKPAPEEFKPVPLTDPIWANASAEQKAAYQGVAQRVRSDDGRQRAYNNIIADKDRQLTTLNRQVEELRRAPAAPKTNGQQPAPAGTDDAPAVLASEDWKKLKDDYPEIAGPLGKIMGSILKENENLKAASATMSGQLDRIASSHSADALDKNDAALTARVSDWVDIRETPEWINWLSAQPKYVLDAARRNGNGITDVDEAADLFNKFKLETGWAADAPPTPAPVRTPANGSAAPAQPTTTHSARRDRQLNASRTVSTKGPAPATGAPEEFGDAFDFYVQKQEAQARAANR